MRLRPLLSAAAVAVALVVVASANSHWFDMHVPRLARAESGLTLIATRTEIPVGPGARLGVRLVDSSGTAVTEKIVVEVVRLDMAPDGMPGMTAALRRVEGSTPGEIAFTGDIAMAGRWALSLSAMVEGRSDPVTGTVVFTAAAPAPSKAAGSAADKGRILYYRHPMGLSDRSSVPKKDSMGMDYIAVYEGDVSEVPGSVRIAPEKVQRAGVRTAGVERRQLSRTIQAPGTVTADESRIAVLTAKFEGFVEELLVPVTGADVAAGQPLVRIWIESRDILQKQSDFLSALRSSPKREADIQRTENNLRLFGIPQAALDSLRQSGEPVRVLTLAAAMGGTVLEKPAANGMRFAAGDTLYRIVDLSTVWVMAQVTERDLPLIRAGQHVKLAVRGALTPPADGEIAFIYPELNMATRTVALRIIVANADRRLRLGQYVEVAIDADFGGGTVIAIPDSAVIDSGRRRVAFVAKDDGLFEPRDLELGARGGGFVEVRAGLAEGERIVVTGNFLIDAESNLRAALQSFTPPESAK